MWITDWTTRAACKGTDPDELFVQDAFAPAGGDGVAAGGG